MALDLDCVDGTGQDATVQIFRQRLPGAIQVNSFGQMVGGIEARLGASGSMRRLRVFGHGAAGVQAIGGGQRPPHWYNTIQQGPPEERILARLNGRFDTGGWAELHGCSVGHGQQGRELLRWLARLWHVRVAGGTIEQTPDAGFEYRYVVALPNGTLIPREGTQKAPEGFSLQLSDAGLPLLYISPIVGASFIIGTAVRLIHDS